MARASVCSEPWRSTEGLADKTTFETKVQCTRCALEREIGHVSCAGITRCRLAVEVAHDGLNAE